MSDYEIALMIANVSIHSSDYSELKYVGVGVTSPAEKLVSIHSSDYSELKSN